MRILVATDGSTHASRPIALLSRLPLVAKGRQALAVAVVDARIATSGVALDFVRERTDAALERTGRELTQLGWSAETSRREGDVAEQILEAAAEFEADLIVVGSRGGTRARQFLLGNVAHKVVKYAPCSVLVARLDPDQPPAPGAGCRLLVADDGSRSARFAMKTLTEVLEPRDVEATVVRVLPLITYYRQDILQQTSPEWPAMERRAREELERSEELLRSVLPAVSSELLEAGDVSEAILDAAEARQVEVIVVGHKGVSEVRRFLLGSVANRVVYHAPCSVWVIRDRDL